MLEDPAVSPEPPANNLPGSPRILSREEHSISRRNIDPDALKVMGRLIRHGYLAFLVGGGVRDLLLGRTPKDYDIGTDARPEELRRLFRNSRIIGRRFRLIHVFFHGNKIFEVSTFRQDSSQESALESELTIDDIQPIKSDNEWGDPLTDAFRRDLTINGLFYNLHDRTIIDYVGGIQDLNDKIIRIIGEPVVRFREDPVRMIRVVRHAARTGFQIEPRTAQGIRECRELIKKSPGARVYEEVLRELQGGAAAASFKLMYDLGLLQELLPALLPRLTAEGLGGKTVESPGEDPDQRQAPASELFSMLERIDSLVARRKEVPAAAIFAALLITGLDEGYVEQLVNRLSVEGAPVEGAPRPGDGSALESGDSPKPTNESSAFEEPQSESASEKLGEEKSVREQIHEVSHHLVNEVLLPLNVPKRDREIVEILLSARSWIIYNIAQESSEAVSKLRRQSLPDMLPALADLTNEARLFRPFFRNAQFKRPSQPKPRHRRRRRPVRPFREGQR